jgi:hypothetical protein
MGEFSFEDALIFARSDKASLFQHLSTRRRIPFSTEILWGQVRQLIGQPTDPPWATTRVAPTSPF